mgnify:CR=1 FL=1
MNKPNEIITLFKHSEKPEVVLSIIDDLVAARLILAWTTVRVRLPKTISRLPPNDTVEAWEGLWRHCRYPVKELATRAGLSVAATRTKMEELAGNRALYPDGTINSFVERYLRKKVVDILTAKPISKAKGRARPSLQSIHA